MEYRTDPRSQTKLLCFTPATYSIDQLVERQNFTPGKIEELNSILFKLLNKSSLRMEDVLDFNKVSGLTTNFRYNGEFYSFELIYDGGAVYFDARFRMPNKIDYDSDDSDEKGKMHTYIFNPFGRLYPIVNGEGTKIITLDMYFKFVDEHLTMDPFRHEYAFRTRK